MKNIQRQEIWPEMKCLPYDRFKLFIGFHHLSNLCENEKNVRNILKLIIKADSYGVQRITDAFSRQ